MPLYEYQCCCGRRMEQYFSSSKVRPKSLKCESCLKGRAKLMPSIPHCVVKGGSPEEEGLRVKKQLTKRMLDHEKTPKAKEERAARIRKLAGQGVPV